MSSAPPTFKQLLKHTELNQLFSSNRALITVTTKTTLEKTLHLLTANSLHSLPVRDVEHNSWRSFVTVHQLLVFALSLTYKVSTDVSAPSATAAAAAAAAAAAVEPAPSAKSPRSPRSPRSKSLYDWLQEVYNLQKISETFKKTMVGEVLSLSERINAIADSVSVYDCLVALSQPPLHLHRLVAFNKVGQMEAVISQSLILDFVAKNIATFPLGIATQSLSAVGLVRPELYFLKFNAKTPVIENFWRMYTEGLDCGAIIDDNGVLIGNLSSSDLSSIAALDFNTLKHQTLDYICQYGRRRNLKSRDYIFDLIGEDQNSNQRGEDKLRLVPPIAVSPNATIENVILKMSVCKIHKIWIVDEQMKPISLISLTDWLKYLQTIFSD